MTGFICGIAIGLLVGAIIGGLSMENKCLKNRKDDQNVDD